MQIKPFPGLQVHIEVEDGSGDDLKAIVPREYKNPSEDDPEIPKNIWKSFFGRPYEHKYIEARPGARFSICVNKSFKSMTGKWVSRFGSGHHFGFRVTLDGRTMPMVHARKTGKWRARLDHVVAGNEVDGYHKCMFKFADLDVGKFRPCPFTALQAVGSMLTALTFVMGSG